MEYKDEYTPEEVVAGLEELEVNEGINHLGKLVFCTFAASTLAYIRELEDQCKRSS